MKKKWSVWILCFILSFSIFPLTARADTGPKPSVRITFKNMGDEVCYGTLLSETDSTGPASAWDGDPDHIYNYNLDPDIWQAFVDYEDPDGYYFLQEGWLCSESKELNWTYYPPSRFKVLLYYPKLDTFTVSDIYERYAFDSYFTITMDGLDIVSSKDDRSYDYTWEAISFVCRVVITILLELLIAWFFAFRKKEQVAIILCVNVITQICLNLLLNFINYNRGPHAFIFWYVFLELLVFLAESTAYTIFLGKYSDTPVSNKKILLYTLCANIVSFVGGMAIARLVPGIF